MCGQTEFILGDLTGNSNSGSFGIGSKTRLRVDLGRFFLLCELDFPLSPEERWSFLSN